MSMNIIPISAYPAQVSSVPGAARPAASASSLPFKDMFETALVNIEEMAAQRDRDTLALALGEVDDVAAITINSQKVEMATQLLVQIRNSVLEAYQEIMRTNV